MSQKAKILFIYPELRSFVKKDIELLSKHYDVTAMKSHSSNKLVMLLIQITHALFYLFRIRKFNTVVIFFAGNHSYFPTLIAKAMGVPSLIIVGGTDAANMPEINYGNFRKRLLSYFTSASYRNCDLIVPVHAVLEQFDYSYAPLAHKKQGVRPFVADLETEFFAVENGYDNTHFYSKKSWLSRNRHFLTIGTDLHLFRTHNRKGIDIILAVARLLPDFSFTIVGLSADANLDIPQNVKAIERIPFNEVIDYCSNHKFYLQLSMMEGLPNALCEAMLCECIPIVSNMGSLPEVIDSSGHILKHKSVTELQDMLSNLDFNDDSLASEARKRIESSYPIAHREHGLKKAVEKLLPKN